MKNTLFNAGNFNVMHERFSIRDSHGAIFTGGVTYINHPDTSVCIYENKNNELLLLKQYRPLFHNWFYELPGGLVLDDEKPIEAATREFREETGFETKEIKPLFTIIPSIGLSNEKIHIFHVKSVGEQNSQNLQEDELINITWVPMKKSIEMIKSGEISDGKTVSGILYFSQLVR